MRGMIMKARRFDFSALSGGLLAVTLLLVAAGSVEAQADDIRWLPWYGCWVPVAELREEADAPLLCIAPEDGGVVLQSVLDGEVLASEIIRSDGTERPVEREGCEGWERSEFSADGGRIYFESEQVCEGEFGGKSSSMIAMTTPMEWIDVQVASADKAYNVNVLRYRAAVRSELADAGITNEFADLATAIRTARLAASMPPSIDDVIEADASVHRVAVEAWVVEQGDRFDVDAEVLGRMADAGVTEGVIDMVVAVSYPEKFAIDRGVRGDPSASAVRTASAQDYSRYGPRYMYAGYGFNSFYFSPFRSGYGSMYGGYGYGYPGYSYGGYGYWGYQPNIVYVRPERSGNSGGRAVRGRGYQGPRDGGSSGTARTRGSDGGGSGSVSRGSGSSRGSSTGRKAKRRGGGSD